MKISIITPSLNQGSFIEMTIRSVLNQNYPALEYLVVDGGSTDDTLAILNEFSSYLRWVSEPDHGQADAINKGLRIATGDVLAYLNADDLYLPGTLKQVAEYFTVEPDAQWVYGNCRVIEENGNTIGRLIAPYFNLNRMIYRGAYVPQPAVFWRRTAGAAVGEFDATLRYALDYDYFIRLGMYAPGRYLDVELACFRLQSTSKTISASEKHWRESLMVSERYGLKPWTLWYWIRRVRHYGLRVLPQPLQLMLARRMGRVQDAYQYSQRHS